MTDCSSRLPWALPILLGILAVGAGLHRAAIGPRRCRAERDGKHRSASGEGRAAAVPGCPAIQALIEAPPRNSPKVFKQEMERYEHTLTIFASTTLPCGRAPLDGRGASGLAISRPKGRCRSSGPRGTGETARDYRGPARQDRTVAGSQRAEGKVFLRLEAEQMLAEAQATQPNVR